MFSARKIVNSSAEEIGVKTSEIELESADFEAILDRLNDLGFEWRAKNIAPHFVEVKADDNVSMDQSLFSALKYTLALRISLIFNKTPTQNLLSIADSTFRDMLKRLRRSDIDVKYPSTIPSGQSQSCYSDRDYFLRNVSRKVNF